jgi:transposase
MTNRRTRNHYTKEFKNDAVKLVLEHGYSGYEVARRLGVEPSNVNRWVREHERDNEPAPVAGGVSRKELEAELKRLRKENKRLQMEREILKKAAAFFANESGSDTDSSGSR